MYKKAHFHDLYATVANKLNVSRQKRKNALPNNSVRNSLTQRTLKKPLAVKETQSADGPFEKERLDGKHRQKFHEKMKHPNEPFHYIGASKSADRRI